MAQQITRGTLADFYAEVNTDRIMEDPKVAEQFIYEQLIDYYEKMTNNELVEHITEMGDDHILTELEELWIKSFPEECHHISQHSTDRS